MFGAGKGKACRSFKKPLIFVIAIIYILSLSVNIYAEQSKAANTAVGVTGDGGLVSINMVNADIRDVLSAIAISMDTSIIYLEEPIRVTFGIKDVKPIDALELLLQSTTVTDGQLGYLVSGNVIIVGSNEKLQKDFFNQMALTQFKLNYITAEELSGYIDLLGVPVKKIVLGDSKRNLWAQGTPQALAKVSSVIKTLDRAENFDGVILSSQINLKPFHLTYITSERLEKLIKDLGLDVQTLRVDTNSEVIWINGSEQAHKDVTKLASIVDIPESAGSFYKMVSHKMNNLTYDSLAPVIGRLYYDVDIMNVGSAQKTIWLYGSQSGIDDALVLIKKMDITENAPESQFFTYTLETISPQSAKERIDFLELPGVSVLTLNYPTLSHELLIKCPHDMIAAVNRAIARIDVSGQKIKAPIDYAENYSGIKGRKDLICEMLDIAPNNIKITNDIARGNDSTYYIMWTEDTPENIQKIKDLVALLDSPGSN